jgi:hypothetical protein
MWHDQYHTSLKYVAGSRWLAGNIAFYSSDRPQVWVDWDRRISPWIDGKKLKREGAIFVWDLTEDQKVSEEEVKTRFPQMTPSRLYKFAWLRNKNAPLIEMKVSFLPPATALSQSRFLRPS